MIKRKVSVILLVFALLVGLSSVAAAQDLPDNIRIGWCPPDVTGVFSTATDYFEKAAEDAGEEGLDVEIITQSPAGHDEYGSQVGILEDFIARGVDAIVVSPSEVDVVKPAIQQANREDIPVIVVNLLDPIEDVDVESYIGFSNYDTGQLAGYAAIDHLGGPGVLGEDAMEDHPDYLDLDFWEDLYADFEPEESDIEANIAILEGIAGDFFSRQRIDGFNSVIDEYEGIEVLASRAADWNREKGVSETEDILQSHGDELDVIYAASSEMAIGATKALESAGLEDKIEVISQDGTPESVDMIREGEIRAEVWHGFPEWGWLGTRFAVRAALGLDVPEEYDIRPRIEYKGNTDQFYPDVELEEHDWEEIIEEYQQ
ncbi:MAG: sugar ABC transporter substrate-binding protein [Halanaerobiaceae bacterium]